MRKLKEWSEYYSAPLGKGGYEFTGGWACFQCLNLACLARQNLKQPTELSLAKGRLKYLLIPHEAIAESITLAGLADRFAPA